MFAHFLVCNDMDSSHHNMDLYVAPYYYVNLLFASEYYSIILQKTYFFDSFHNASPQYSHELQTVFLKDADIF